MDNFVPLQQVSPVGLAAANLPYVMPHVMRVRSIIRLPTADGLTLNQATLYHDKANFATEWVTRYPDVRIRPGSLVTVVWAQRKPVTTEPYRVERVALIERPRLEVNLFETVPPSLVKDRQLLKRAADLWVRMPQEFRHLFNGVFWNGERFLKYLVGPVSLEPTGCVPNANFRHCVSVAEDAQSLAHSRGKFFAPIAVLAGLLHDAGKVEDFRYDRVNRRFTLSNTAHLVSHRNRIQHWVMTAIATHRIILKEENLAGLLHALQVVANPSDGPLLNPARTIEAMALVLADRYFSQVDDPASNDPRFGFRDALSGQQQR